MPCTERLESFKYGEIEFSSNKNLIFMRMAEPLMPRGDTVGTVGSLKRTVWECDKLPVRDMLEELEKVSGVDYVILTYNTVAVRKNKAASWQDLLQGVKGIVSRYAERMSAE